MAFKPQIKEQNDLFASIADVQVTTLNELDTLSQGNKREIMKNRGRFIAAVQNDKKRTEQLEGILNEVLLLEQQIAIIKAMKTTILGELGKQLERHKGIQR